jgi:hypothetical protein
LSDNFPIQNYLKQGDVLSPLLFNFDLGYAIRKVPENQVGLKLNVTHQLLVYADDVNLLADNIGTIKKNKETSIDASKKVDLEVNTEKTKYMLLSCNHNVGQNNDLKMANRSFENVRQFKPFGTVTNENLSQEEIKRRMNSGNACNHSVQNILSCCLMSKNVNIKIYKNHNFS